MAQPPLLSNRALARAVGKSEAAVRKWLKDDRWPFPRKPPWPASIAGQIVAWSSRTLAADPAREEPRASSPDGPGLSQERLAKTALTIEKLKSAKFANQLREGQFHRTDECERRRLRQIHEVRTALLSLPESLPFDDDAKEIVRGRILEVLRRLAGESP